MTSVRVRHVADVNPPVPSWERLSDDQELTFVPLEAVWPRRVDFSRSRSKAEVATGYTRFIEGDVVVPKITPTFEADRSTWISGMPTPVGTGTTELHVVRARRAEPRYLDYLFSSRPFLHGGEAEMIGVAGQKRVPDSWIRDFPVPVVDLNEQRVIADYLDTETARIDALITKKRRMIELLAARRSIEIETRIRAAAAAGEFPLKYAVRDVTVGIVITPAAWYVDDGGVPAVRGVNVSPGKIDMSDCVYLSDEGHLVNRKSTIRSGDVLVVRTGQAGAAAVVPGELDGANCIDLLLIRPAERVVPRFLEYVLNSDWTMKHIEEHSVGTIQSHFNVGALRQLPVPLPTVDEQTAVVHQLDLACDLIDDAMAKLRKQIGLVEEHRQALITAAVTGKLNVSKAA